MIVLLPDEVPDDDDELTEEADANEANDAVLAVAFDVPSEWVVPPLLVRL